MCEDMQHQILACLQRIEAELSSDKYEQGIYTVGGGSGNYLLPSPYNTECEFSVLAVFNQGANAAGVVYISSSNAGIASQTSTPPTVGASSNGEDTNVYEGYIIPVTTTEVPILPKLWLPLGRGKNIFINAAMSAGNAYILIAVRRKLDRVLPDKPVQKSQTHSQPLSRRALRYHAAQSAMSAGAEDRAASPGQQFVHQGGSNGGR